MFAEECQRARPRVLGGDESLGRKRVGDAPNPIGEPVEVVHGAAVPPASVGTADGVRQSQPARSLAVNCVAGVSMSYAVSNARSMATEMRFQLRASASN